MSKIKILIAILLAVILGLLAGLIGVLIIEARRVSQTCIDIIEGTPEVVEKVAKDSVDRATEELVEKLDRQISLLRKDLTRIAEKQLDSKVPEIPKLDGVVRELEEAGRNSNKLLVGTNESIKGISDSLIVQTQATSLSAQILLDSSNAFIKNLQMASTDIVDCESNPDCLYNRYVGLARSLEATSKETAETMKILRQSTPRIVANFDKTTSNVERITRPDNWAVKIGKIAAPVAGGAILGAVK